MAHLQDRFPNLHVINHPLIVDKLSRARDISTTSPAFRRLVHEIAGLMTPAATADLTLDTKTITTPLESMDGEVLSSPLTLVPILRAGLGMVEGVASLLPEARIGHLGMYRDEEALEPVAYYSKIPESASKGTVLLTDPMVATGGSAVHATTELKSKGCVDIRLMCLVAAPPGVEAMMEHHPDVPVFAAALDRELNEKGYILPGLGDAGDRIFGTFES